MLGLGNGPPTHEEFKQHMADAELKHNNPEAYKKEMERREEKRRQ